jgi:2-(1,2-epoxy-1,2-dihydrophenyl)acetyl-CoA isomerase
VVADEELDAEVAALAGRLAAASPGALATIKRTLNARCYAGLDELLELEALLQQERVESADFLEGVSAFLEGRQSRFAGA